MAITVRTSSDEDVKMENPPFRLLDLPVEIWSRICKLSVVRHGSCPVRGRSDSYDQPPITRVCRIIRDECLTCYYASNLFFGYSAFHHDRYGPYHINDVARWLNAIGLVNAAALRNFYFESFEKEKASYLFGGRGKWLHADNKEIRMLKEKYGIQATGHGKVFRRWTFQT